MRFLAITLIVHGPDPVTGARKSTVDRFREVVDNARLAEELGFDGGAAQRELFHVTTADQWHRNAESYDIFRRLWRDDRITAAPRFRPAFDDAEVWPPPLQRPIRVWPGSATGPRVGGGGGPPRGWGPILAGEEAAA
jgi:alkanesulfonate monooxygenase SsuD/methylene tetrahydromethanopterin reductase-like flavin-dependent oxidoreductase (luciferase family)